MPERARLVDRVDLSIAGLTLIFKAAILGLGVVAVTVIAGHGLGPGPLAPLEIWNNADAPHYLDLAALGYRAQDTGVLTIDGHLRPYPNDLGLYIVFFPLYPWLVAAVRFVVPDVLLSAFVVSGIASLLVGPLLYRLVKADEGPDIGLRAVWFLLVFPTAYFLHIGYTESLFLALVLGSFLAARTNRWWLAGILGGLAALTRINGLILLPALMVGQNLQNAAADARTAKMFEDIEVVKADMLTALDRLDLPVLAGPSRKGFLTQWHKSTEECPLELMTAAAVTAAILNGAHIVRVHAVGDLKPVVQLADQILGFSAVEEPVKPRAPHRPPR